MSALRARPGIIFSTFESAWLRGVFIRALSAAVASSLGAAGCAESSDPAPCDEGVKLDFAELKPAELFDYAALRVASFGQSQPPDYVRAGTPCSGAEEQSACQAALNDAPNTSAIMNSAALGCGMTGCNYLVTTRGDEVKHYITREELLEFLGPIDSPEDVRLLLLGEYSVECNTTRVERSGTGFRVTTLRTTSSCPVQFRRALVEVSADGDVDELSSELLSNADPSGPCA